MERIHEHPASIKLNITLLKLIKWYHPGGSGQTPLPSVCTEIIN